MTDDLKAMADRLRLVYCRDNLDELLEQCKVSKLSPYEILQLIFKAEISNKERNRIRLATMAAHFPRMCSFEDYDFTVPTGIDEALIRDLYNNTQWIKQGRNIILLGPPGVGKTHLAIAFGRLAVSHSYSVLFKTTEELLYSYNEAKQLNRLQDLLIKLSKVKLLIIDELGYVNVPIEFTNFFYQLINMRYEKASTIITSNRPTREWSIMLGDSAATAAILDRFLHHCSKIIINGDSYRMAQSVKDDLNLEYNIN